MPVLEALVVPQHAVAINSIVAGEVVEDAKEDKSWIKTAA